MKTWTLPVAVAQKFAANEYVAACYQIYCFGPQNNDDCDALYADTNNNGVYDAGIDETIVEAPYGYSFYGCNGYHRVIGQVEPHANGFVKQTNDTYMPVFYWFGSITDPVADADVADFHFTDLTRADAVIYSENPNHS